MVYKLGFMANPPKNERMFDLRVVHRYIGAGRLEKEEYDAHLESLVDVAENVRPREEGGDEDGYDRPVAAANEPRRLPLSAMFVRPKLDDDDDDDDDDFDDDEDDDDDDEADGDKGDADKGDGDKADADKGDGEKADEPGDAEG